MIQVDVCGKGIYHPATIKSKSYYSEGSLREITKCFSITKPIKIVKTIQKNFGKKNIISQYTKVTTQ